MIGPHFFFYRSKNCAAFTAIISNITLNNKQICKQDSSFS